MKLRIMESSGWDPLKVPYEELIQMIEDTANKEYGMKILCLKSL